MYTYYVNINSSARLYNCIVYISSDHELSTLTVDSAKQMRGRHFF